MQLTSSPRRALGLLAASTIGLSTALLGVTGAAQAVPLSPNAPTDVEAYGGDTAIDVWFNPNDPPGEDEVTPWAETWEYELTSDAGTGDTDGFEPVEAPDEEGLVHFELDGLTNGEEYTLVLRGVDEHSVAGAESEPVNVTPYKPIGAPGTPTVVTGPSSLKVSWTAPTVDGTYDLAGYDVLIPMSQGESGGPATICSTDAATTECTFGVQAGITYDVWVLPIDAEGNDGVEAGPVTSGVVPAPAVPATVPAKDGDLTLAAGSSSTVAPGQKVTVSGTGYAPGSSVSVIIYSTPQVLTTVVADASGNFTVEVTIPAGLAPGNHTLVASGVDANGVLRYVSVPVTVTAAGTTAVTGTKLASTAPKLADTGADVTVPALGGIATLGLGAGLIALSRRRRTAA